MNRPKLISYYDIYDLEKYGKDAELDTSEFFDFVANSAAYGAAQNTLVRLHLDCFTDDTPEHLRPFLELLRAELGSEIDVKLWW